MTSIFDRIANLTKATLHEALNKLEDPILMTGQYLRNLEEDIEQAKSQLTSAKSSAKLLHHQLEDARNQVAGHEQQALEAIAAGNETWARRSVEAKLYYEAQAAKFAEGLDAAEHRAAELELQIDAAKDELERLKKKREDLAQRAHKASERKAEYHPNFSNGFDTGAAAKGFERMEEKINGWEASSNVYSSSGNSSLNRSLVDEELERLQNKAKGPSQD